MAIKVSHVTAIGVFALWLGIRIFPLLAFPYLYSFDAWTHLGVAWAIALENHIPAIQFTYYYHPALHILAVELHQFLGLTLLESLQAVTIALSALTFAAFYIFLRRILAHRWQVWTGMTILALSPDFLAQTNAPLPEYLALLYLALAMFALTRLVTEPHSKIQNAVLYVACLALLYLSHHLATLMFSIACLAFLFALLISRNRSLLTIGAPATILPCTTLLVLLGATDPFVMYLVNRYTAFVMVFALLTLAFTVSLAVASKCLPRLLDAFQQRVHPRIFILLGLAAALAFLLFIVVAYPIERTIQWRILKFGAFAVLLGLSIVGFSSVLKPSLEHRFTNAFLVLWILCLGLTFSASTVLASVEASWGGTSLMVALASRHFTYLEIVMAALACLGLFLLFHQSYPSRIHRVKFKGKLTGMTLAALLGVLLVGGCLNVYFPAGGWFQSWFTPAEVQGASWLADNDHEYSTTVVDYRAYHLFLGVRPFLLSNHESVYYNGTNPTDVGILHRLGNAYFFVSDTMERQFMVDGATPPRSVEIRSTLDLNVLLAKILNDGGAAIYYTRVEHAM